MGGFIPSNVTIERLFYFFSLPISHMENGEYRIQHTNNTGLPTYIWYLVDGQAGTKDKAIRYKGIRTSYEHYLLSHNSTLMYLIVLDMYLIVLDIAII